ncbi:hypothetical protein HCN44_009496 [Aphidius gifuensis]|uniref:Uncharacterized protein n=1 Tax=Aphidius gifuensis TaxID=684658 RepID=A0A834Y2H7_APHGI|nr:protein PFC0760c-like [Aphidius gifuensis]KAF7998098.1 hypothetical protein HCN44_009496 [Aphidius gifuensis]
MENIKSPSSSEETPSGVITFGDEDPKLIALREEFLNLKKKIITSNDLLSMVNEQTDKTKKLERKNGEMKIKYENDLKKQETVWKTKNLKLNEEIEELTKKLNKNGFKKNESEVEKLACEVAKKNQEIERLNRQIKKIEDTHDEKVITMTCELQAYENKLKEYENEKVKLTKINQSLNDMLGIESSTKKRKKTTKFPSPRVKNKSIDLDLNLIDDSDIIIPNTIDDNQQSLVRDIKLSPTYDENNLPSLSSMIDLNEEKPSIDLSKILITIPSDFKADIPIKCDQSTMTDDLNKSLFINDVDNNLPSLSSTTNSNNNKQLVDLSNILTTTPTNLPIKTDQSTMTDSLVDEKVKPERNNQSTMTDEPINNSLVDEKPKSEMNDQSTMTDELINNLLIDEKINPERNDQSTMTDELINTNKSLIEEQIEPIKCDQPTDKLIKKNKINLLFGDDTDKDEDDEDNEDDNNDNVPSLSLTTTTSNFNRDKQQTNVSKIPTNSTIDREIQTCEINKPKQCNQSKMTDELIDNSTNDIYPLFCNKCKIPIGARAVDIIVETMKVLPPPLVPEFSKSPVKSKSSRNIENNSSSSVVNENISLNVANNSKRLDDIERRLKICEEYRAAPAVDNFDTFTQYLARVANIAGSHRTEEPSTSSSVYREKRKIDQLKIQKTTSRKRKLSAINCYDDTSYDNDDNFDDSLRLSDNINGSYEEGINRHDFNDSNINNNVLHNGLNQFSKIITNNKTRTTVGIHRPSGSNENNLNTMLDESPRGKKRKNSVPDDVQPLKKLITTKKQGNIIKKCNNLRKNSSGMVPIIMKTNKNNNEVIENQVDEPPEPDLPCKKKIRKAHTSKANVIEDNQIIDDNKIHDKSIVKTLFEKRITRSDKQNCIQNNTSIKSVEKKSVKSGGNVVDSNKVNDVKKNLNVDLNDDKNNQLTEPVAKDVEEKNIVESESEMKTEKANEIDKNNDKIEENNKACDLNLTPEDVVDEEKSEVKNLNETKDDIEMTEETNKQEIDEPNENKEIDNNVLQVSEEKIEPMDITNCSSENLDDKKIALKDLDTNSLEIEQMEYNNDRLIDDLNLTDSEDELEVSCPSKDLDDKKLALKDLDTNSLLVENQLIKNKVEIEKDLDMSGSEGELEISMATDDLSEPPIEQDIIFEENKILENLSSPDKLLESPSPKKFKSPIKPPVPCSRELRNRRVSTSPNEPTSSSSKKTIQCYLNEYLQKNKDHTKQIKPLLKGKSLQIAVSYKEKFENIIKNELNTLINHPEWNKDIQESVTLNLVNTNNQRLVAKCIVELLNDKSTDEDDDDDKLDKSYSPPAPLMTVKEQKIICLIVNIENKMPDIFSWIYKTIEKILFTLNNTKINKNSCLSRIYVVLSKIKKDRERVRIMCCDALYCLKLNALHIIHSAITTWPEVLPFYDSNKEQYLMCSIAHIITSDTQDNTQIIQVKKMIKDYYKYPCKSDDPMSTSITNMLINAFILKPDIEIKTAIILLAKKEDCHWTYKNIIPRLIEIICDKKNPMIIGDAVKLIGSILRSFPVPDDGTVGKIIDQLRYLIDVGPTSPDIQESLITALLSLSRFRFDDVARTVMNWEPPGGVLSPILQEQFDAFFKLRSADSWTKIKNKTQKFSKTKHFLPACTNLIEALQLKE